MVMHRRNQFESFNERKVYMEKRTKKNVQILLKKNSIFFQSKVRLYDIIQQKKPYPSPSNDYQLSLPPPNYKPIGIQLLARHGSRSLNSHDYDMQTLRIWQIAKDSQMLTQLGKELKIDTDLFMFANNHVGRGQLTELGRKEHYELGQRLYKRLKCLFHTTNQISIVSSGKKRATDSGEECLNGIVESSCSMDVNRHKSNKNLLYFHKTCTNYLTFRKTNLEIKTILNSIKSCEQTRNYAQQILKRIYRNEFVDLLINNSVQFSFDDHHDPKESIPNEVAIVLCLYSMFAVSPAQDEFYLSRMLAKYFTEEESNWFAFINDAQEYYFKGPSIEGTTVTYDMAKPLLLDFFSSIDSYLESKSKIAVHLRFAHAETLIPFATLLQIPGYSNQCSQLTNLYSYENNPWRGDLIAPMGANIQWEIYEHEHNPKQILIRMLYNEVEARFKHDCQSISSDSFFYDYQEIKRAYYNDLCK